MAEAGHNKSLLARERIYTLAPRLVALPQRASFLKVGSIFGFGSDFSVEPPTTAHRRGN